MHMCKPVCLSVHLWMDAWSLPSFGYYEYVIHKECCQEHVKEVTRSFSTITAPFNFPIRNAEGPNFSTPSPIHVIFWFFDSSHPNGCEVVSHGGFYLYFPND